MRTSTERVHATVVLQKKAGLVLGSNLVYSGWEFTLQLDNQSITIRNRMFISLTDMYNYGFNSRPTGVCISRGCVMGGLGWVHKLMVWVGLGEEKWTHVHL